MLVEVLKGGRRICQILEAPGEYYFNPRQPGAAFPSYVNAIINGSNRKIWAVFVEPDWLDQQDRLNYVTRITKLKQKLKPTDKVIFVLNKIDKTNYVISPGEVNIGQALQSVANLYPNIQKPFENQNPISKLWNPYLYDFVPFQTGDFNEAADGSLTFDQGPDEYPAMLWNKIMKQIKG